MKTASSPSSAWDGPALRIGHLISSQFAGGPEKQIVGLSVQLRERGWSVDVGSFLEGRPDVEVLDRARRQDLPTFAIETRHPFDPSAITQLRNEALAREWDVLVTHGYKGNVLGRMVSSITPATQIAMVRGFTAASWKIRRYEDLDRLALRMAPMVLCVSEGTRRVLAGHGMRGPRYRVLHNAVDCNVTVEPADLRAEYGIPSTSKVLVAAGRLSPEKGHRILVDAMQLLRTENCDAHCLIFGDGQLEESLERQIRAADLGDYVRLAGFRRDALACLAGADLVVNPSFSEGLPNVLLEAMSLSTACVATAVGGVGELIEDGRTGWLVPANDPSALASAIRSAVSDDAARTRVAEAARAVAVEKFSFEEQARCFAAYCRELVSGARQ